MATTETTKKNKAVYWVLGIGLLAAIIYAVYKYTSLPKLIKDTLNPKYNTGGDFLVDYGDEINTSKVLTLGDKGNNVTRLQTEVNKWILDNNSNVTKLSVDGIYGEKTEAAIKAISGGLLHSGNVTVNGVANLNYLLSNVAPPTPPPTVPALPSVPTFTGGKKLDGSFSSQQKFNSYTN